MIFESIQLLADALNHPTYGVNAMIPSMSVGTGSLPPVVNSIVDETRDAQVARGLLSSGSYPQLVVTMYENADIEPMVMTSFYEGKVPILIRYLAEKTLNNTGAHDALMTLRAVEWTLRHWMKPENNNDRTMNNIQVITIAKLSHVTTYLDEKDIVIMSGLLLTLNVRDVLIP